MTRTFTLVFATAVAAALGGCNAEGPGVAAMPTMTAEAAPSGAGLPPGAPCTSEIGQYRSIVKADRDTGNVEEKVYVQIDRELARAASACAAGKGGEAHALVAASKARHGYRA